MTKIEHDAIAGALRAGDLPTVRYTLEQGFEVPESDFEWIVDELEQLWQYCCDRQDEGLADDLDSLRGRVQSQSSESSIAIDEIADLLEAVWDAARADADSLALHAAYSAGRTDERAAARGGAQEPSEASER